MILPMSSYICLCKVIVRLAHTAIYIITKFYSPISAVTDLIEWILLTSLIVCSILGSRVYNNVTATAVREVQKRAKASNIPLSESNLDLSRHS